MTTLAQVDCADEVAVPPRNRLTPSQRALAGAPEHVALALSIARRMARSLPRCLEEFESAALLGLVDAAARFDPARELKFKTFAVPRITGSVLDYQRDQLPRGFRRGCDALRAGRPAPLPPIPLSTPAGSDDGRRAELGDFLAADEMPVGWELESLDAVLTLSRRVPPQYGLALRRLYVECATAGATLVGPSMGVCQARGSQLLTGAVAMLRESERGCDR